ncbi:MAG: hypothetical protein V1775_02060 [Bacteroidota bacterium]
MFSFRVIAIGKPHCLKLAVWLPLFLVMIMLGSCSRDETVHKTSLILKTGQAYTADNAYIPTGGTIRIGVLASGAGAPLTYIRIDRITGTDTVTQLDRGLFAGSEGLDADFTFAKDTSALEIWNVLVMNADRIEAMSSIRINKGEGSAYGPVKYFGSIVFGLQDNQSFGHFVDIDAGLVYDEMTVTGKESTIDVLGYYYVTSGLPSPTLTCPGYTAAVGYYPLLSGWSIRNNTLYDYLSTDNNLVSAESFDSAINDSLLITAYKPDKVSGNCKYCYTGKIVPFKTMEGKYGLIKVIRADEAGNGTIEIAVKIQQ